MKYVPEHEAHDRYDEMLDECCELVRIGSLTYDPSHVLKNVDPIAYRCGFVDWLDSEDLTTDESEADEKEFTSEMVDEMENANYFGDGDDVDAIRSAWYYAHSYSYGDTISDQADFDTACQDALEQAIAEVEASKATA